MKVKDRYAVKDRNGQLLIEPERIAERWREYFSELLNVGGIDGEGQETVLILNDLQHDGQESQITLEELKAAISQMKREKAAGDDGIPVEILKAGGSFAEQQLLVTYNIAYETEYVPSDWHKGVICPLLKKGDKTFCDNYRSATLLYD